MSQESNASIQTEAESENVAREMAEGLRQKCCDKQRIEIQKLNRKIDKIIKERDNEIKEKWTSSIGAYDQIIQSTTEFFESSQEGFMDLFYGAVSSFDKSCHDLIADLNEQAYLIDPNDAEDISEGLSKDYSNGARQMIDWRRRLVKENYQQQMRYEEELKRRVDAEKINKAVLDLMSVNEVRT